MRYFLTILLLISSIVSPAQVIDSLESMLTRPDLEFKQRIDIKNELARELTFVDPLRSIQVAKEVLEAASKENYKKGKAYAYRNLAGAYSYFGSFYLTIDNMQKARYLFEELKDSTGMANCMISLGHTYRRLRNRELELENNLNAFLIFSRLGNAERIGVTALNLGETYFLTGDQEKSFGLTRKAIHINDSLHNLSVLSACYKVMGLLYLKEGQLSESESYFNRALDISAKLGKNSQKLATIESMISLAKVYDLQGRHDMELELLIRAATFVSENRLQDYVQEVYLILLDNYLERSNVDMARKVINAFKQTQDSVTKTQMEDRNRLTMGFIQLFEMEKKNEELATENQQQEIRIKSRNQIIIISLLFFLVVLAMVFILVNNVKKLKKTNSLLVEKDRIITLQNLKLEELNATKDKFFSVVSHDMRAPLNSLWSFTQILEQNIQTLGKDQLLEMVKAAREHLKVTSKMTENLLAWAKLQMKEMNTQAVEVEAGKLIADVCSVYSEIAQSKQIDLTYQIEENIRVFADKDQLDFIIRNLINNALKYTPPGGKVRVSGEAINERQFRIQVTDSGKGMKQELINKLFTNEPITSSSGTMGEQGTGLGLKLCYEFARLNNGTLLIVNKEGQGAEISLVLPLFRQG